MEGNPEPGNVINGIADSSPFTPGQGNYGKSDPFISVSEVVHPEIGGFSSTRENTFPYIVVILFYLLNLQV